ncbi:hypothetical protein [Candidatus Mycoplasma haematobovis]|nr:hypothetical protein [Candidatus Mycoplasma haematobovis]
MAFPVIKSSIFVALLGAIGGGVAFASGLLGNSRQADKQRF